MRIFICLLLLQFCLPSFAEKECDPSEDVQWLNWPMTASPYGGMDSGILMNETFDTHVRKDVVIGLRSDGTVVWKHIKKTQNLTDKIILDKDTLNKLRAIQQKR